MNERSFLYINVDQPMKQAVSDLLKEKMPTEVFTYVFEPHGD